MDAAPRITSDYIRDSAKKLCSAKYPNDFAMQGGCKRNIEQGAESIADLQAQYLDNNAMLSALANCVAKYTEDGVTDFAMAGGCARNNEAGFLEMNR